jgi:hypothetical protein
LPARDSRWRKPGEEPEEEQKPNKERTPGSRHDASVLQLI